MTPPKVDPKVRLGGSRSNSKTSAPDLRGQETLRSALVSNPSRWSHNSMDDLDPCELIGEGKYGVVHTMIEKATGQMRVVKTVERPTGWNDSQLKLEAEILQNLDHPHILRIFSWYEDGDAVNIVMEHCEGGELMKVVKEGRKRDQELPENWAATCLRQTFEALVYIHFKGVIHKDLKSANLLLLQSTEEQDKIFWKPPHVVICDLGLAEVCSRGGIFGIGGNGRARRVAGTPVTMAPEVWKGNFGPKSDVWSMGCVMFELMTGEVPFKPDRNEEALWAEAHRRGANWSMYDHSISEEALELNQSLLTVKETARPSAGEVLHNPWLRKCSRQRMTPEETQNLISAVQEWKYRNPMQRAVCLKMAAGCTCLKKFASLFSEFDTDNSGILDQEELMAALDVLGVNEENCRQIAAALDVNSDGSCEYIEFAAACLSSLEEEFDELLRQEFNFLDTERKTWLTPVQMGILIEELRPLAEQHGLAMEDVDANGDGVISFGEFFEYFGRPGSSIPENLMPVPGSPVPRRASSKVANPNDVKQLPMKQHIRIIKEDAVESFISAMQESMEVSRQKSGTGSGDKQMSGEKSQKSQDKHLVDVIVEEGVTEQERVVNRILQRMQQSRPGSVAVSRAQSKETAMVERSDEGLDASNPADEQEQEAPLAEEAPVGEDASNAGAPQNQKDSSNISSSLNKAANVSSGEQAVQAVESIAVVGSPDPVGSGNRLSVPSDRRSASAEGYRSSELKMTDSSERSVSREQAASMSQSMGTDSCGGTGCWLTEGPLKWLGIQRPLVGFGCGKAPKSDCCCEPKTGETVKRVVSPMPGKLSRVRRASSIQSI